MYTVTDQFLNDLFVLCLVIGLIELKFTSRHSGIKKGNGKGLDDKSLSDGLDGNKPERCTACA